MDHSELSIKLFRISGFSYIYLKSSKITSYQFSSSCTLTINHDGRVSVYSIHSGSFSLQGWLLEPGISFSQAIILDGSSVQFRLVSISLFRDFSYQIVGLIDWFSWSGWLNRSNHSIKAVSQSVSWFGLIQSWGPTSGTQMIKQTKHQPRIKEKRVRGDA